MAIKAIETEYKGYRFRSRLEARWAVFFDTLRIDWDYEPEGFDLGNEDLYLPDFWLPDVNMWAEVKAMEFSPDERRKCELLVKGTGHPCLMLIGIPENKPYFAVESCYTFDNDGEILSISDGVYCLTNYHNYPQDEGRFYSSPGAYYIGGDAYWDDTEEAAKAARSARFEHGETP